LGETAKMSTNTLGVLNYRVNGLTNIEIKSRVLSINPNIGPTESGLGDTVFP